MRRTAASLLAALIVLAPSGVERTARAASPAPSSAAPHAWLFGAWTGGLFPAPSSITAQACLAQPTVIFTRDVVLRGSLTDVTYSQRVIETARTNPGGTDFQFSPALDPVAATSTGLLGMDPPKPAAGFGCMNPDALRVERRTDNEITFPGCSDFPNPLVRCPAR
jgi:hypothetical protein